ncbi:hypothetical protein BO224_04900 [Erysipelotrichaceae bacterium NYU-BL-E8]|uniref:Uncharacterized protein n=1 Tax=Ileibacterium valens TaxID=1862668 RepID=A0A1U7NHI9_9FIRM|nr:hypothetical protein BM735_07805 [Erysipelotrichaceae bacterium NYU-BL-F16]OLU40879.1 hypothetical protein BO224_04900 [Erysipelotrichaceae bacterium NYU-BL-E8]OLU41170.1 hypothetical protein BO222_03810 [Ileibacterium valens]
MVRVLQNLTVFAEVGMVPRSCKESFLSFYMAGTFFAFCHKLLDDQSKATKFVMNSGRSALLIRKVKR